ncbi:methylamine utilization protein [Granulosicoccus sp. 3-233]|uniref:methylamine utilization protein n=1 Tax=Granulosicoccus sp. 3-233 TaxID=3417969 RepID=UPI003D3421F5
MNASNVMSFPAGGSQSLPGRLAQVIKAGLLACLVWNPPALAAPSDAVLSVSVVDARGHAMEHAVVSLHSAELSKAATQAIAVMDQQNLQFAPSVVAVQAGTLVEFPNQDDVRHHVYSFSHPNAFELKLYHGQTGNYNRFDHPGVVVLGCNIHDGMLGYLRVVDTPLFATSDEAGRLTIGSAVRGVHQMQVWHPDMGMKIMRQDVTLVSGMNTVTVRVNETAAPMPDRKPVHSLQSLFRD